jgi:hypothetical protein
MIERSWHEELPRFRTMTQIDQLGWLSQLLHLAGRATGAGEGCIARPAVATPAERPGPLQN